MRKNVCFPSYKWAWSLLARRWLRQFYLLSRQKILNILVGIRSKEDFKNFWFFEISGSSRTTMSPNTFFYLAKKLKKIMVGFCSRLILWADFKNFWFFEISGSSLTKMSLSTFLYLVKKSFEIMVGFGRGR